VDGKVLVVALGDGEVLVMADSRPLLTGSRSLEREQ
jgi:hypothetical protein